MSAEGRSIQCDGCGGTISFEALRSAPVCPYCRHAQTLDRELVEELAAYQRKLSTRAQQLRHQVEEAQDWGAFGARGTRGRRAFFGALALTFGVPLGLAMLVHMLASAGVFGGSTGVRLLAPVLTAMVAFVAGLVTYLISLRRAPRRGRRRGRSYALGAEPLPSAVSCPDCGANTAFERGQVLEECAHCGSSIMPSPRALEQGLRLAHDELRAAQMVRYRAERAGMKRMMGATGSRNAILVPLGVVLLLSLAVASIASVHAIRVGSTAIDSLLWVWGVVLLSFAAMLSILLHRRHIKEVWMEYIEALASRFGGAPLSGVDGVVRWLDTFWGGSYETAYLQTGATCGGVACNLGGYPALIFIDPLAEKDKPFTPKLHLFVAACLPGLGDGTDRPLAHSPATRRIAQQITSRGLSLEYDQAGLFARADVVTHDVPPMAEMAQLARALGASAVAPIS